ncbi:MAG: NCS2 family permease [Candidatus Methanomethylophilaceae archaeon]|nr:NCS2 family permease [Candidatus Methanomethylophilaceae archaeon]
MSFTEALDSFFHITERGSTLSTEIKGGVITFLAMCYILVANPAIVGNAYPNIDQLFTATAIAACVSCILMGIYARFPVALAPGMGINAFITYTIVGGLGFSYPQALMAVFISGILFIILSVTGFRTKLINSMPKSFRMSITAGIGFFIAYIGLVDVGLIVNTGGPSFVPGFVGTWDAAIFVALVGIFLTLGLYFLNKWYATLAGIIGAFIVALILGEITAPTEWVTQPDFGLFGSMFNDFGSLDSSQYVAFVAAILSLLFVDVGDTTGTLVAVGGRAGFIDEGGNLMDGEKAMQVDSIATIAGAAFGTTTTTAFIESTTGIENGARTGIMPIVVGLLFAISLFLAPVFGMITYQCIVGALFLVGVLMLTSVKDVEWNDPVLAGTAFATILIMGLSYSITNGIGAGAIVYVFGQLLSGRIKETNKFMIALAILFAVFFILNYAVIPRL